MLNKWVILLIKLFGSALFFNVVAAPYDFIIKSAIISNDYVVLYCNICVLVIFGNEWYMFYILIIL